MEQESGVSEMDRLAQKVIRRIATEVNPRRVFLFGSRANGHARPESDVDVLLLCDEKQDKRALQLRMHRLFPAPDFSLDVFVLTEDEFERQKGVSNTLAREVSERGVCCG